MNQPTFDQSLAEPLVTDAAVEQRVTDLIGRANQRQFWLLFLDPEHYQLPVLMPVDGLPSRPPDDPRELAGFIEAMADLSGAASVVIVIERYGKSELTKVDRAWAAALHAACEEGQVPLRALLLSHRGGVRWIAQDDYRF